MRKQGKSSTFYQARTFISFKAKIISSAYILNVKSNTQNTSLSVIWFISRNRVWSKYSWTRREQYPFSNQNSTFKWFFALSLFNFKQINVHCAWINIALPCTIDGIFYDFVNWKIKYAKYTDLQPVIKY